MDCSTNYLGIEDKGKNYATKKKVDKTGKQQEHLACIKKKMITIFLLAKEDGFDGSR